MQKCNVKNDAFNVHSPTSFPTSFTYYCKILLINYSILFSRHLDIAVLHCERVWSIYFIHWNTSAIGNDVFCSWVWETLHKVNVYFRVPSTAVKWFVNREIPKEKHKTATLCHTLWYWYWYELIVFALYCRAFLFILFFHFVLLVDLNASVFVAFYFNYERPHTVHRDYFFMQFSQQLRKNHTILQS